MMNLCLYSFLHFLWFYFPRVHSPYSSHHLCQYFMFIGRVVLSNILFHSKVSIDGLFIALTVSTKHLNRCVGTIQILCGFAVCI